MQTPPVSGQLWEVLGISQYQLGDFSAATQSLLRAMELTGREGAEPLLYLAMAYQRQGDHDRAKYCYDQANSWIENGHPAGADLARLREEAKALICPDPAEASKVR